MHIKGVQCPQNSVLAFVPDHQLVWNSGSHASWWDYSFESQEIADSKQLLERLAPANDDDRWSVYGGGHGLALRL